MTTSVDAAAIVLPPQHGLSTGLMLALGLQLKFDDWGVRTGIGNSVLSGEVDRSEGNAELSLLMLEAAGSYAWQPGDWLVGLDLGMTALRASASGTGRNGATGRRASGWSGGPMLRPYAGFDTGSVLIRAELAVVWTIPETRVQFDERDVASFGAPGWLLGVRLAVPLGSANERTTR